MSCPQHVPSQMPTSAIYWKVNNRNRDLKTDFCTDRLESIEIFSSDDIISCIIINIFIV
jgi:hypothetical protein